MTSPAAAPALRDHPALPGLPGVLVEVADLGEDRELHDLGRVDDPGDVRGLGEIRELDPAGALSYLAGCRANADRQEAKLVAAGGDLGDPHPVTEPTPGAAGAARGPRGRGGARGGAAPC